MDDTLIYRKIEMEELKLVMEGLKDAEEGRVVDGPTAMAEIRREYGL